MLILPMPDVAFQQRQWGCAPSYSAHVRSTASRDRWANIGNSSREEGFESVRITPCLIRRRRLHMINDQNLDRGFMRFEFQPKLLLDHGKDRRS